MSKISIAILMAGLSVGSLMFADTFVFDNPGSAGGTNLGFTHTYSFDGQNITASGFNGGTAANLSGKNNGVGSDEDGLGIFGLTDNEINFEAGVPQDFVQLDMTNLLAAGFTGIQFEMGSTTSPEAWEVFTCTSSGVLCDSSPDSGTDELTAHNALGLTLTGNHVFLDFTATSGNVLLGSIVATPPSVPEPRVYGVLLAGMLVLAGIVLRKRQAASQA